MVRPDARGRGLGLLHRVLFSLDHHAHGGQLERSLVRVHHQRDLRTDELAADPVALQGDRAADMRDAAAAGRFGTDQEFLRCPHRHRARAQGEDRAMTPEILLGLVMLIVMLGAIFIGIQISFTLLFLALSFGYFALGKVVFDLAYFQTIGLMKEEVFAAVPLFIFMGFITEQAGLMGRLFSALRMVLAPVRGSLYIVVIVTSTIFAMATGIVGAAVTVLGIMAAPIMIKTGYDAKLSAGAITPRGTLRLLLPPPVLLVLNGPGVARSGARSFPPALWPRGFVAGPHLA